MILNQKSLPVLSELLNRIYIVLEEDHVDMKSTFMKFVGQINHICTQKSGSINIAMPEGDIMNEDAALRNKELM